MRLVETSYHNLSGSARALAKLATIARNDCRYGGARASVIAERAQSMGLPLAYEMADCVSQAYTSSSGSAREYLATECPECGSACAGQSAALECCAECFDEQWELTE
jgi:hypothetical protein